MHYVATAVVAGLVGFGLGVYFNGKVRAEIAALSHFLTAEVSKIHAKLDSILATVKK